MKPETLTPQEYHSDNIEEKRQIGYGTYLVIRKDGKSHLETFNGSQFAYNDNSIKYYYLPKIS